MGSTDAFELDDLAAIAATRDRLARDCELDYRPHLHADAVIGWAWSVFNDYDFDSNPLGFGDSTRAALAMIRGRIRHLDRADTVGVDFHKTGYTPYVSSLILACDGRDFMSLADRSPADAIATPYACGYDGRDSMDNNFERGDSGRFTLETSRSGAGPLAALANLLLLGRDGLRALLGHTVEMSERLRADWPTSPIS